MPIHDQMLLLIIDNLVVCLVNESSFVQFLTLLSKLGFWLKVFGIAIVSVNITEVSMHA